ncbi:type II secretion system protein N [Parasphingopyxis sp.]|uniref:type II secretion system protein N n=1 Tax=Parasphingopyxis sp. TaxID=1920299 RepID=UPI002632C70C|nr:type II secretion system protein N [Parasphingopyxis sp.]
MAERQAGLFQLDREAETSPRRLAILIGGGLVALFLLLWIFRDGEAPPPAAPDAGTAPPAPAAPAPAAPSAESPTPPSGDSVASLRLHGVMGLGDTGAAIVSNGAGPQRLVRVGREVLPGVPLLAVAGDHILVRENGREVRLAFEAEGATAAGSSSGGSTAEPGSEAPDREAIEYQAALTSYRIDGRHAGYQFREGRMPEIFQEAGVQPDDVLLRFGGFRLESSENVASIPGRIRQGGWIEIEILRNGEEQTIVMDAR